MATFLIRRLLLRPLLVLAIGTALPCQTPPSHDQKPLMIENALPDLVRNPRGPYDVAGVAFYDDEHLILHAVDHDVNQLSSRKSPAISSPFRLHAWSIDANSGRREHHREWGTRVFNTQVIPTAGGVLVQTGSDIKLYSPDFESSRDLPIVLEENGNYFVSVSSSGLTVAISHYFKGEHNWLSHIDVLDARTLTVRSSWYQYPPLFRLSMTEREFVTERNGPIVFSEFGTPAKTRLLAKLDESRLTCPAGSSSIGAISDTSVVLRDCREVLLATASGNFSLDTFNGDGSTGRRSAQCRPYYRIDSKVAVAGTRYAALVLPKLRILKPFLAEQRSCLDGMQIAVYDLTLRNRVLAIDIDPMPDKDFDFALSPDGKRLAILKDRDIAVYKVPIA